MPPPLPNPIFSLTCLLGILLIAGGMGRSVLNLTGLSFASAGEKSIFSTATGLGILSTMVFLLGLCRLLYPSAILLILGLFGLIAVAGWISKPPHLPWRPHSIIPAHPLDQAAAALLAFGILAGTLLTLTPALGNDSLTYHLAVPKLFLRHHGLFPIPGNIFSHYPLGSEMLYVVGMVTGGEATAKGIHFAFAMLILAGMWQLGKNQLALTVGTVLAPLIFFTIPSVFITAHTAYNDLAFSLYILLAVYAFLNWFSRGQDGWLAFCGVLSGLGISIKYAGLLIPLLGIVAILWACRRKQADSRRAMRLLALFLACTVLVGSPYYIRNWIVTGNPFYPFFYKIFGGLGWDAVQSRRLDMFHYVLGMGRELWDYLKLPWRISFQAQMNSPRFDGVMGPIFILTLPFALAMRRIPPGLKVILAYCGGTFLFWAFSVQQIRYLIPIFPFLALTVAFMLGYFRQKKIVFTILLAGLAVGVSYNGYHVVQDFNKIGPIPVVTGGESREAFYRRLLPSYDIFSYLNRELPPTSNIFFIYMKNHGYLCDPPYYSDSIFESYTMEKILSGADNPLEVRRVLKKRGITHILYDIGYVFGEHSTFSPRNRAFFKLFQDRHLQLIKTTKNRYYLFRMP